MDALKLLRSHMASNRIANAHKVAERRELDASRQQFSGTFIGGSGGSGFVRLDEGGGVIPCEITAGRILKPGQSVMATLPSGASRGWVDGI